MAGIPLGLSQSCHVILLKTPCFGGAFALNCPCTGFQLSSLHLGHLVPCWIIHTKQSLLKGELADMQERKCPCCGTQKGPHCSGQSAPVLLCKTEARAQVNALNPVLWFECEMPSRSSCVYTLVSLANSSALQGYGGRWGLARGIGSLKDAAYGL